MFRSMPTPAKLNQFEIARLLSGQTPDPERKALLTRLAADPDAQELLRMALEALQAAEEDRRGDDRQAA